MEARSSRKRRMEALLADHRDESTTTQVEESTATAARQDDDSDSLDYSEWLAQYCRQDPLFPENSQLPEVAMKVDDSILGAKELILNSLRDAEDLVGDGDQLGPRLIIGESKTTGNDEPVFFWLYFAENNLSGEENEFMSDKNVADAEAFEACLSNLGYTASHDIELEDLSKNVDRPVEDRICAVIRLRTREFYGSPLSELVSILAMAKSESALPGVTSVDFSSYDSTGKPTNELPFYCNLASLKQLVGIKDLVICFDNFHLTMIQQQELAKGKADLDFSKCAFSPTAYPGFELLRTQDNNDTQRRTWTFRMKDDYEWSTLANEIVKASEYRKLNSATLVLEGGKVSSYQMAFLQKVPSVELVDVRSSSKLESY